jgi:cytochrome c oxidase assembly protein subunit 15
LDRTAIKGFNKLCLSTLVAVYVLILVGSVVRSTGSGMGCPDWPKCFGSWLPPSSANELPPDYKDIYSASRVKKNIKFVGFLRTLGMDETASKLENDKTVLMEEDFSPLKSRIEYANRVVGVIIGLMISLVLLRSFRFLKESPVIFITALAAWLSVVFTGWFGSIVVSTNLTPWTVSVHLGFAILIVGLLIFLYSTGAENPLGYAPKFTWLLWLCLTLSTVQMILGVQVREALDQVAFSYANDRESWISRLGLEFLIHRSFSWVVFLANAWLSYKLIKNFGNNWRTTGLLGLTLLSVISGVGMAYGSVPAYLQPLHLLLSTLIFGLLLLMLLQNKKEKTILKYA